MGGYLSVLVGSVSVCHFKLMNRLENKRMNEQTHGPGCEKAPTIWALLKSDPIFKKIKFENAQ